MNLLIFYNQTQTYTNTIYDHLRAFSAFSRHRVFYAHSDGSNERIDDLSRFDAVIIHFSVRLPFNQISQSLVEQLEAYRGLKVLFIQDEYDHTHRAWYWIRRLGISLVFTVVPEPGIARVYPPNEFPGTRFVNNLTGYVPFDLSAFETDLPPSRRELVVGYRGRPLPLRYGQLGFEKVAIGRMVRDYCRRQGIRCDIAWDETSRIYGDAWPEFVKSCRAMLGSESGSNVFDWEGDLDAQIAAYRTAHPRASDDEVYRAVVQPREMPGLMNQISPRVFETIAARTVLVLLEGRYSDVLEPDRHFIAVRKDGSNLDEVFARLADPEQVDEMARTAHADIIGSGKWSYQSFVARVDDEIERSLAASELDAGTSAPVQGWVRNPESSAITTLPVRAYPPVVNMPASLPVRVFTALQRRRIGRIVTAPIHRLWAALPNRVKTRIKRRLLGN